MMCETETSLDRTGKGMEKKKIQSGKHLQLTNTTKQRPHKMKPSTNEIKVKKNEDEKQLRSHRKSKNSNQEKRGPSKNTRKKNRKYTYQKMNMADEIGKLIQKEIQKREKNTDISRRGTTKIDKLKQAKSRPRSTKTDEGRDVTQG